MRKRTLKPFVLMSIFYFFNHFSGLHAMRPYVVLILKAYGTPIDANLATVLFGLSGILGTILCVLTMKFLGKRRLFLLSLFGNFLVTGSLSKSLLLLPLIHRCVVEIKLNFWFLSNRFTGIYGFLKLPPGWTSFSSRTDSTVTIEGSYFPMIMVIMVNFFTASGISPVPSALLSEMFPFK